MIGTCAEFSKNGRLITTRGTRIPALDQAYLNVVNKWWGTPTCAVCITNTDWNQRRHDKGKDPKARAF
jgi:hypothetical protein